MQFEDCVLPISSCSLCPSNSLLGAYLQADWRNTTVGLIDYNHFFSCTHANAVISWISYKVIPQSQLPEEDSPTYREDVATLFTEYLTNPPSRQFALGSWILTDVHYTFKSGRLYFFLSEHDGVYTFCNTRSTSGRRYLYCFLCPRSRSCTHIAMTPPLSGEEDDENYEEVAGACQADLSQAVTEIEDSLISKQRYPFVLDEDESLREVLRKRMHMPILKWFDEAFPDGYFKAEKRTCCDSPCEYFPTSTRQVEFFSLHGYSTIRPVLASLCTVCQSKYDFDGRSVGILNYGNRYLFTVELILDLLEFKAISGTPTYSYWLARCNTLLKPFTSAESVNFKKKWMSIAGRVNGIMTAYLALVDYPSDHFQCCEHPEVVCIDGIVLSVESRRIQNSTPWVDPIPIKGRFKKKDDRYIIVLKQEQKDLLKVFIRSGLHSEDLEALSVELSDPLGQFLSQNCYYDRDNRWYRLIRQHCVCPGLLKRFYHSLCKWISPASSIAPSGTWDILEDILTTHQIPFDCFQILSQLSPVLYDLISYYTTICLDTERFGTALALLEHLLDKAKGCFVPSTNSKEFYQNPLRAVRDDERTHYTSVTHEVMETGAYFPGRPYHSIVRDIHLGNESTVCNKEYKKKGRLGPGTLLFWCGKHRKCIGFYIMQSAESCKTVYTILATRFPKQPRVIIYDNGCNLSEYILNRGPLPFKDTYILSDGFHWKNHTNCGISFNSKLYPDLNCI